MTARLRELLARIRRRANVWSEYEHDSVSPDTIAAELDDIAAELEQALDERQSDARSQRRA